MILSALTILGLTKVFAQQVSQVEYFLDEDPGYGNASSIAIDTGDTIKIVDNIDLSNLENGTHILFLRAKNDQGIWSQTTSQFLTVYSFESDAVVEYVEYFFGADPGFGNGTPMPLPQDGKLATTLDLNALDNGISFMTIRIRDNHGAWSVPYIKSIVVGELPYPIVTQLEYFMDEDPGFDLGTTIEFTDPETTRFFVSEIDLTNLSNGLHTFYIRAKDSEGVWGQIYHKAFVIMNQDNLTTDRIEYFIDEDPGLGEAVALNLDPTQGDTLTASIDLSELTIGTHTLGIRVRDEQGVWSNLLTQEFELTKESQTIMMLSIPTKVFGDDQFLVEVSSDSELPVSLSSSDPEIAKIVQGNSVRIVGAGTVNITATQEGNEAYFAAEPVEDTLIINKAELVITAIDQSKTYGTENPDLTMDYDGFVYEDSESAIDELPQLSTSATLESDAGMYDITLSGGADDNYTLTLVSGKLTITKADQSITFDDPGDFTSSTSAFELNASATSGLEVSFTSSDENIVLIDGLTATVNQLGEVSISASQEGNHNYNAAEIVTHTVTISEVLESLAKEPFRSVYPNPVSDRFRIKEDVAYNQAILVDVQGRQCVLKSVKAQEFDIGHLPNGAYFLLLLTDSQTLVIRVLKR